MKEIHLQNYLNEGAVEAGCDEAGRGPLAGPVFAAAVILPPDFHHPLLNDSKQMSAKAREILRPIIEREAVAWAVEAVSAAEIDRINILNASIAGMQRAVMRLSTVPEHLLIDGNRFRPFSYILRLCLSGPAPELFHSLPPLLQSLQNPSQLSDTSSGATDPRQPLPAEMGTTDPAQLKILQTSSQLSDTSSGATDPRQPLPAEEGRNIEELIARAGRYDAIPYTCIVKGDAKFTAIAAASVLAKTHRDEYMRSIAAEYPAYGWDRNMGYPTPEHIQAIRQFGLTPHHRLSFRLKSH